MVSVVDPGIAEIGQKPGLEIYRIMKLKLEPVPSTTHGAFYTGDAYVIVNTLTKGAHDVHFWLGKGASQDEIGAACIKSQEIDQALKGHSAVHREIQDHESPLFSSYFKEGIRYVEGGYDSGVKHIGEMYENWTPKLFHCKGKRNIRCSQVACKKESLNLGDVFLLDLGKTIYCWMPPESGRLERIKGMSRAKNMAEVERGGSAKVVVLDDDWKSDSTFWKQFGGKEVISSIAKAKDDDENYWKRNNEQLTLWKVSDASGKMEVSKVATGEIKAAMLDTKDCFILDAVSGGIFVWLGKECTLQERAKAMMWGDQYLDQKNLPLWTRLSILSEGSEPALFSQWLSDWSDEKKKKSFEPRLHQVSDESGTLCTEEVANYTQECLDGDDVMILDALSVIYVWIGAGANKNEKEGAEAAAKKFISESNMPRPKTTSVELLHQGKETPNFQKLFPKWDEQMFKGTRRTVAEMRAAMFK